VMDSQREPDHLYSLTNHGQTTPSDDSLQTRAVGRSMSVFIPGSYPLPMIQADSQAESQQCRNASDVSNDLPSPPAMAASALRRMTSMMIRAHSTTLQGGGNNVRDDDASNADTSLEMAALRYKLLQRPSLRRPRTSGPTMASFSAAQSFSDPGLEQLVAATSRNTFLPEQVDTHTADTRASDGVPVLHGDSEFRLISSSQEGKVDFTNEGNSLLGAKNLTGISGVSNGDSTENQKPNISGMSRSCKSFRHSTNQENSLEYNQNKTFRRLSQLASSILQGTRQAVVPVFAPFCEGFCLAVLALLVLDLKAIQQIWFDSSPNFQNFQAETLPESSSKCTFSYSYSYSYSY
jgi:hypothetical protein